MCKIGCRRVEGFCAHVFTYNDVFIWILGGWAGGLTVVLYSCARVSCPSRGHCSEDDSQMKFVGSWTSPGHSNLLSGSNWFCFQGLGVLGSGCLDVCHIMAAGKSP